MAPVGWPARAAKYLARLGFLAPRGCVGVAVAVVGIGSVCGRSGFCAAASSAGQRLYAGTNAGPDHLSAGRRRRGAKFVNGRDIPGEWWKVFHSKEIDALIAEALRANPNLQAAQAALWQAKETLYAQAGTMLPSCRRQRLVRRDKASRRRSSVFPARTETFNLFQATVNVSYAPDVFGGQRRAIEASAAAAEISALRARSDVFDADCKRGDGGDSGSLAARPDRSDAGHHQSRKRPARGRPQSIRSWAQPTAPTCCSRNRKWRRPRQVCRRCKSNSSSNTTCCWR